LPSRALARGGCGAPGVGLRAGEDGVADLAFERAQRFFRGFAFGQFLVVVRGPWCAGSGSGWSLAGASPTALTASRRWSDYVRTSVTRWTVVGTRPIGH